MREKGLPVRKFTGEKKKGVLDCRDRRLWSECTRKLSKLAVHTSTIWKRQRGQLIQLHLADERFRVMVHVYGIEF